MAGKSSKGRSRRGMNNSANSLESSVTCDTSQNDNLSVPMSSKSIHGGASSELKSSDTMLNTEESCGASSGNQAMQGEVCLYSIPVKTQSGQKIELQLNPGDSVMDIRQFLLDAPETCYLTCYELLLYEKNGSVHHLEDHNEISEVADITSAGCYLEMVPAIYDDRSIRAHVHRARELLSLSSFQSSLSTSLALRGERPPFCFENSPDALKVEFSDLDGLALLEDVKCSLHKLFPPLPKEIKCLEHLMFSSFNPPPSYRRLAGDLIYLDVVTLENNKFCITGSTRSFYVNASAGNSLDPRRGKACYAATTLIGLLQIISAKFNKAFHEVLDRKSAAHPYESIQSVLSPNSWLGIYPIPDHKRDTTRAESALVLSYGCELIGMQRDWNEELQSCRDFPHSTPQERILRDRALYKVTSDFVDATVSGAVGVINGCIPPINPTDPECFHMYVHNNIFFSFAVDSDMEKLLKASTINIDSQDGSADLACGSYEEGEKNTLHMINVVSNGHCHTASDSGDLDAANDLSSYLSSTLQFSETEQATYASANNDLKGTRAYQEADVPGLYNLAMAIIDYRGHRVIAQSVLPGILQGDKSNSLLYGSVDHGKKICWNEEFHVKVLEAAKRLNLKEHSVSDASGNVVKLAAPVECKGIVGSDDRHYILDLMRVTPRDANYRGTCFNFCILRPELISSFSQRGGNENTDVDHECNSTRMDPAGCCKEVVFNPNAFTEFQLVGSKEEIAADEEIVKKAAFYLKESAVPKFIQDLCTLEVSPMDGQTLTEALHAHGINVRYIGKVANGARHLPHIWDLCTNEIVVRSAKHIIKRVLRVAEDHDLSTVISHFFNCLFGNWESLSESGDSNVQSRLTAKDHSYYDYPARSSRRYGKHKDSISRSKGQSLYMLYSSRTLWSEIANFAKFKYQFELPEDAQSHVRKVCVLRNLCQKVGIKIVARVYDFDALDPFQSHDILDLQPVVKHSIPVSFEARHLVEKGKVQLAEGMLSDAYTSFSEGFAVLQQVTGPMHRDVANCCRYLAMVLYHAGDIAGAILQQHKELIVNERCLGLDHPDTAHSYGNLALFYHGLSQTEIALRHISRALLLLGLSCGQEHPDVACTFINVAMMYQDIGKMDTALRYLQEALKKNEGLLGEEHIQTAVCYHALAIAFNSMGAFKLSHQHEKKTYDILVKQVGEDDPRTQDSHNWLKTFKMRELQMNAQKQKGQLLNAASAQKAIDILKAYPDLVHAFQTAASGKSEGSVLAQNKSNTAMGSGCMPRGRGNDVRAARAAAEVRKKAAARGLLARPHGLPVQSLPPLTQFLNIINSGIADNNSNRDEASEGCVRESGGDSEGPAKLYDGQTPVGLGNGLASINGKQQKAKQKTAS